MAGNISVTRFYLPVQDRGDLLFIWILLYFSLEFKWSKRANPSSWKYSGKLATFPKHENAAELQKKIIWKWQFPRKLYFPKVNFTADILDAPVCVTVISGLGKKHKWQNWNTIKSFEINTILFGSSQMSFPSMSSLKGHKNTQKRESLLNESFQKEKVQFAFKVPVYFCMGGLFPHVHTTEIVTGY